MDSDFETKNHSIQNRILFKSPVDIDLWFLTEMPLFSAEDSPIPIARDQVIFVVVSCWP